MGGELLALQASEREILMGWFDNWALLNQVRDDLERRLGTTLFDAAWERGKDLKVQTAMGQLIAWLDDESTTMQAEANDALADPLTARELEVLALVAQGYRNRQIAERFFITTGTVKVHVNRILRKLDAKDRHEAVARAHAQQLLQI